jgi:alpha-amylase
MEVADYLIQAQLHWAKSMGLDGFRLDTVKHVSLDVWQELRRRLDAEIGPHFFLLGEVWGGDAQVLDPYFEAKALNAGFDFSFKGNVTGWLGGRGRTIAFSRYLLKRHKVRPGHHLAHYLSSHDEVGTLFQLDNDVARFKVAAFLQLTTLGIPVIYYGEEVGRLGGEWPENRSDMPWGDRSLLPGKGKPRNEELWHFYQELLRCRREHPPLSRGTFREVHTDGDVLVFAREWEGQAVYVVASRSATDQALVLSSKEFAVLPTLLFGDVVTKVVENGIEMALPAHGVALFAPGEQ